MTASLLRLFATGFVIAGLAGLPEGSLRAEPTAPSGTETRAPLVGKAVLAVVSIRDQRVSLYDADGGALRANVSSGRSDYETPVGVYAILQKKEQHTSNLYDDAEMPFMQRITWSGIALHAGQLPGRPASHGCVRMPHRYSEQIFPLTRLGMRVVVAYADVAPVEITHSLLFQPEPIEETASATPIAYEPDAAAAASPFEADVSQWPARQALLDSFRPDAATKAQAAQTATARADAVKKIEKEKSAAHAKTAKALKRAEAAKRKADDQAGRAARWLETAKSKSPRTAQRAEESAAKAAAVAATAGEKVAAAQAQHAAAEADLAAATTELAAAEATKTAAVTAANEAKRKMLPVSVFVSRAAQRLYVRQGHAPVLDVPVTITDPEMPIGTYVYTAVGYDAAGNTARWTAVSTGPRDGGAEALDTRRRTRKSAAGAAPPPTDLAGATAALDRITLPADLAATLSRYVWPGSSLIVSDEEISKETGEATDFVVLISGEPQGGIKKRPRRPPMDDYYYSYDDRYYEDYQRYYDRRRRPRYNPRFFSFW